jgi:hypothetical protein
VAGGRAHRKCNFLGRSWEAHRDGPSVFDPGIAAVERKLERLRARPAGAQSSFEIGNERVSRGDPPMLLTDATRFALWPT